MYLQRLRGAWVNKVPGAPAETAKPIEARKTGITKVPQSFLYKDNKHTLKIKVIDIIIGLEPIIGDCTGL